jgi:thioredoxin-related protein
LPNNKEFAYVVVIVITLPYMSGKYLRMKPNSFCLMVVAFIMFHPFSRVIAGQGINFTSGLAWQQITELAHKENRYIFVECFVSGCESCTAMASDVYSSDSIGQKMNAQFISVKVQMDTSANDKKETKAWYADAHVLMEKLNIHEFPTYLFFSPDGRIIHKDLGYKNAAEFETLISDALNPERNYFVLLKNFEHGNLNYHDAPFLINSCWKFGERDLADSISRSYLSNYLYKLPTNEIYTRENLYFIGRNLRKSDDTGFMIFYRHEDEVDQNVKEAGYAERIIASILEKEGVNFTLGQDNNRSSGKPNWSLLVNTVSNKFNKKYAEWVLLDAEIRWYGSLEDWENVGKYKLEKLQFNFNNGIDTLFTGKAIANNIIYFDVFLHCDRRKILRKAARMQREFVNRYPRVPAFMDTYANLLYKLGKKNDALYWQSKAAALRPNDATIKHNFERMQLGKPTWESN